MGKQHAPAFLKIATEAKKQVKECTVADVKNRLDRKESFQLIDVREDHEWEAGHLPGAIHLGKGVIERDIEKTIPDTAAPLVLYCEESARDGLHQRHLNGRRLQRLEERRPADRAGLTRKVLLSPSDQW
jgi:rhodanese-related sulfurtransferase